MQGFVVNEGDEEEIEDEEKGITINYNLFEILSLMYKNFLAESDSEDEIDEDLLEDDEDLIVENLGIKAKV